MKPPIHVPYISRRSFLKRSGPFLFGATVLANTIRELRFLNDAMAQEPNLTDYKALIVKAKNTAEKLSLAQKLATKRLASGVVPELDECFAALELH